MLYSGMTKCVEKIDKRRSGHWVLVRIHVRRRKRLPRPLSGKSLFVVAKVPAQVAGIGAVAEDAQPYAFLSGMDRSLYT